MQSTLFQGVYRYLLLGFLGVMSVSGTIALRNVLHAVLLVLLVGYLWCELREKRASLHQWVHAIPLPLWVWGAYLLLFPLIAPAGAAAMENLIGKGMWGESLLTWLVAWGGFLILGAARLNLWTLALVSAVPVGIHLILTLLAWCGVLQPAFYSEPSLQEAGRSLWAVLTNAAPAQSMFETFPIGFRGVEPMHGNLGYPASQAMCLALPVMYAAWRKADRRMAVKAGVLVALCFVSVVIAQSRAATYFGLLILVMSLGTYWMGVLRKSNQAHTEPSRHTLGWGAVALIAGIGVLCLSFFVKVASENVAWYSMWDKMAIGFQIENPQDAICNGLSSSAHELVHRQYAGKDAAYTQVLIDGLQSDGGRVLLARVGLDLSLHHPWGWNAGRDAYQYRIEQVCGHAPVMNFSHAHNAWINLALALGWLGAALYAVVLLNFLRHGWRVLQHTAQWPAGLALLLLSLFWLVRGMFDAVYQEHYLEMQAFFLLTVYLIMRSNKPVVE